MPIKMYIKIKEVKIFLKTVKIVKIFFNTIN